MKSRISTLFILAALFVSVADMARAQDLYPPAGNEAFSALTAGSIGNGNFEGGHSVWEEFSALNHSLIVNSKDLPVPPHGGSWAARLGGTYEETSLLRQSGIMVSGPASRLWFWYWIDSEDQCKHDYGYVAINNADTVYTWDLCAANNTHGWKNLGIDLSAYDGQTITLSFMVTTNEWHSSDLFIDDVILGGAFADVPGSHPNFTDIEILYANGLTGGCAVNPLRYCPDQSMNRGQAAVFMLRAGLGAGYVPPAATHLFTDDWTTGPWAEPWAEAMYKSGLSAGCFTSPLKFCPWTQIPREQAVIFALRMKYGTNYTPPPATGNMFADLADPGYYVTAWAEQAYTDGIIPNCGTTAGKPNFCPKALVSRGLGAYMIVRAKGLTMP